MTDMFPPEPPRRRGLFRRIADFFTGGPAPPELPPYEPPPYEEPAPYVPPYEEPPPYPGGEESFWFQYGTPSWWNDSITIYGGNFQPITYTAAEWYEISTMDSDYLMSQYGIDNYDIIRQLRDNRVWDESDLIYNPATDRWISYVWVQWRELYAEQP